jgi:hypothetical protein
MLEMHIYSASELNFSQQIRRIVLHHMDADIGIEHVGEH